MHEQTLTPEQQLRERCLERILSGGYVGEPATCRYYAAMADVYAHYILTGEIRCP